MNKPGTSAQLHMQVVADVAAWLSLRICTVAALRLMEVRLAYANEDFEWDNLQQLSVR